MDFFKLKEKNTTISTEIIAGVTTFMTMAYILVVNPNILSDSGMDKGALFTATALAAFFGTAFMALLANYPIALAPGLGINAYFAYTVAAKYGWEVALLSVFIEGLIFILLSVVKVREKIFNTIPKNLKYATSVGIGLFITLIGLSNAGIIVVNNGSILALGNIKSITVSISMLGIIITSILIIKKVKGALFWGILSTWIIGIIMQLIGVYEVNPEIGNFSLIPDKLISFPPSIKDINLFTAVSNIKPIKILDFLIIIFSFLFVDMFNTVGALIGVSEKGNFLDKKGNFPKLKQAFLSDALATTVGAVVGTSPTTTFIESAAGIAEGGRTGLTSLTTSLLFLASLIFAPIFITIPSFATSSALIIVGLFMVENIKLIDFSDYSESIPSFIIIFMIPFAYNIADGLVFGILSYVLINLFTNNIKKLNITMIILFIIFSLKLFL